MIIIDGKKVSSDIKEGLKKEIEVLSEQYGRKPKLAVVLVGEDPASKVYVRNKERACVASGIESLSFRKDASLSEEELLDLIDTLNKDETVDGILVQLPLPKHINEQKVIEAISPDKDVDGFHPESVASLVLGTQGFRPCTPSGVMELLDSIDYDLQGKEVVVIGRSNIVGKPVALMCLAKNATVTIAHSKTKNLKEVCKKADVVIAAVGRAKMIDDSYIKDGAVVIDVGINHDENGKLCGDVDYEKVVDKVHAITPVPGGVGPMTIAILMKNTVESFKRKVGK